MFTIGACLKSDLKNSSAQCLVKTCTSVHYTTNHVLCTYVMCRWSSAGSEWGGPDRPVPVLRGSRVGRTPCPLRLSHNWLQHLGSPCGLWQASPPPCLSRRYGCLWTHTIQFLVGCFLHLCNSIHLPGFNCTLSALGSHFPFPAECSVSEGKLFLKYCISFLLVSIIVILHDKAFPAIGYY